MAEAIERAIHVALTDAVGDVFPGASAAVAWRDSSGWSRVTAAAGERGAGLGPVTRDTIYDLASLTKPVFAMSVLRARDRGEVSLDASVAELLPHLTDAPCKNATLTQLLTHRSGLHAHHRYYASLKAPLATRLAKAEIVDRAARDYDASCVGQAVYSDLGYIIAGEAVSRELGRPQDQFRQGDHYVSLEHIVEREVSSPLGLELFYATQGAAGWKDRCAPTTRMGWRGRLLLGEVNDDNCAAMGGVAAHAGLFGAVDAVTGFGCAVLDSLGGHDAHWRTQTVRWALQARPGGSHRVGWDGVSEGSSAGSLISQRGFGHLGYTGTSLWCDPERQVVVTLLSNRVYPDDSNVTIRAFRPRFHDAVFSAFDTADVRR